MSLAAKLGQIKEDTERSEQRSAELRDTMQQMKDENNSLGQELGEAQRKLKLKEMELEKIKMLLNGVENRFNGLQENKNAALVANSEMDNTDDQCQELADEAKLSKEALFDLESQLKHFESKKKVIYSNITKVESRVDLLRKKRDTITVDIDAINKTIQDADYSNNKGDYSEEDLLARIRELDAEILRVSVERENFQRKTVSNKNSEAKINKQIESINNELQAVEAEVEGLNSL